MKALVLSLLQYDPEAARTVEFIERSKGGGKPIKILDVGCGYGRFLKLLAGRGHNVTGVEMNPKIVAANRAAGLNCLGASELNSNGRQFDVILMSHIVEHFAPDALLPFLDGYLDHLKPGGHLVICTPLLSPYFYDDFDHVKPYQPAGILMFFGSQGAQVQRYSRNRLVLEDIWFRKSYWRLSHLRPLHVRTPLTPVLRAVDAASALLFRLTCGRIGRTDGWVGRFRKVETVRE